jgi:integrase
MTRVRDFDGKVRQVERYGRTQGAARNALALALRDRARVDADADITPDTKLAALAGLWFEQFQRQDRSPTTVAAYRDRLDKQIIPALGNVRARELSVGLVDRHLRAIGAKHGPALAKQTKTVLGQVCGLAVRHDALEQNPVRETSPISTKPKNPPRALTETQALQLKALLTYDDQAVARDLPALVSTMLASGLRLGEAMAVTWEAVDFEVETIEVRGTVIREKGQGLRIKSAPKSKAGVRKLRLPKWCVELLRERAVNRFAKPDDPVFPAPLGGLRDPSNTAADIKDAFEKAGFGWATSHTLRKTTATMLDRGGLTAREIADQLGHANPSMTHDRYLGRGVASPAAAAVLEHLA